MILRDVAGAAQREFDLIIVGGGIYGVSLLQEAARRGLSGCLCEADDFGGGTSANSLRIVHGGLRYLQTMDLPRFFQSVAARRRVAQQFPTLVRPLRCLMPLYGQGMKRVSVMRLALLANDFLSARRNVGLQEGLKLPPGEVLDAEAVRRRFPGVRTDGLEGGACWSDYFMVSSERILIELLHDACRQGAVALNYATVEQLIDERHAVRGVRGRDRLTGESFAISGRAVVNCAGPRATELTRDQGGAGEQLFRPSLAFNLLLDIDLPVDCALAVAAPRAGSPVLFLVPQPGSLLAGTMHLPRPVGTTEAKPTELEIASFLAELNQAIPGLGATAAHVRRVFAGLLPAAAPGSSELEKREVLLDHGKTGGLAGFFSVSGVKYTTANDVACQVLDVIKPDSQVTVPVTALPLSPATGILSDFRVAGALDTCDLNDALRRVVQEEAVQYQEDLLLRRTSWIVTTQASAARLATLASELSLPALGD